MASRKVGRLFRGAGEYDKVKKAMQSLDAHLVDRENMLIKLLSPAFADGDKDPRIHQIVYSAAFAKMAGNTLMAQYGASLQARCYALGDRAYEYFCILNPIEHARTKQAAMKYKVEPYVVAADIYSNPNMLRSRWMDVVHWL